MAIPGTAAATRLTASSISSSSLVRACFCKGRKEFLAQCPSMLHSISHRIAGIIYIYIYPIRVYSGGKTTTENTNRAIYHNQTHIHGGMLMQKNTKTSLQMSIHTVIQPESLHTCTYMSLCTHAQKSFTLYACTSTHARTTTNPLTHRICGEKNYIKNEASSPVFLKPFGCWKHPQGYRPVTSASLQTLVPWPGLV